MSDTALLGLPLLAAAQSQKHVTHNEALLTLDALTQISVLAVCAEPPATCADGERYLVGAPAVGAFAGRERSIARRLDGAWRFYPPAPGWLCWNQAETRLLAYDGAQWRDPPARAADMFGVQATPDATNRLAVASPAALFTHAGADMRVIVNKAAETSTGALMLQSNWSGRAEFGLTGDDDLHLKVSDDGTTWREAMIVSRASGAVAFPGGGVRRQIRSDLAYYVSASGSDAADGLSPTSAFATLQKAWDTLCKLDLSIYTATINVAAGAYGAGIVSNAAPTGGASIIIQGDVASPASTAITTSNHGFYFGGALPCPLTIRGFKIAATGASKGGVVMAGRGVATCLSIEAGAGGTGYCGFYATQGEGARIIISTGQTVSGSMPAYVSSIGGVVQFYAVPVTLTGAPAFSWGFAQCANMGMILAAGVTFSGTATGLRYGVSLNSVIHTNGGGANFFPGSVAGTASSGGQYV